MKAHFDTLGFLNGFTSDNTSMIAQMANLLHKAMDCRFNNKLLPLPKIIVVVPDDDLVKLLCKSDVDDHQNIGHSFNRILNFIMTEYERGVSSFKEFLPAKCVNTDFPQFLWIAAPMHENFNNNNLCFKFNRCLEETCKLHPRTTSLTLKPIWDPKDTCLYLGNSQRFTAEGYHSYWEAVDRMVRYFDSVLLKKQLDWKKSKKVFNLAANPGQLFSQKGHIDQKDRFQWQNPLFNKNPEFEDKEFCRLPPPPSHAHQ